MGFRTKLDFSDNRQVKQRIETISNLSGATTFGVPYGDLPTGPNTSLSSITQTINNVTGTFSGNSGTTVFTWTDSRFNLGDSTFSAITPSNSGVTQNSGNIFTPDVSSLYNVDGNTGYTYYTGVSYSMYVSSMTNLGGGSYSGNLATYVSQILAATGLDFTGRTIWNDVSGITRTNRLIITDNPMSGYVWTCIDSEGFGEWQYNGSSSGSTIWTAGTGTGSAVLGGSGGIASGSTSVSEGTNTIAGGPRSHAEGEDTQALGENSHAEGLSTIADGKHAHAEGELTIASNEASHAEGVQTLASGFGAHSEGYNTLASGDSSHAEGENTIASFLRAHAEGYYSHAEGQGSHAEGGFNNGFIIFSGGYASGNASHAEGTETIASGTSSHAQGANTIAGGDASHAEGLSTIASGYAAHAEGSGTIASGDYSHAEGFSDSYGTTIASGDYSHAEGWGTLASGDISHAQGYKTIASGDSSHAGGNNAEVHSDYGFIHSYYSHIFLNSDSSAILGGFLNNIDKSTYSGIFVGQRNTISGGTNTNNIILGGEYNAINNHKYSTIINGSGNTIHFDLADYSYPNSFEMIENSKDSVISASTLSKISSSDSMTITNSISSTVINSLTNNFDPDPYITGGGIIGTDDPNDNGVNTIIGTYEGLIRYKAASNTIIGSNVARIDGTAGGGGGANANFIGNSGSVSISDQYNTSGYSSYNTIFGSYASDMRTPNTFSTIIGSEQVGLEFSDYSSIISSKDSSILTAITSSIIGGTGHTLTTTENSMILGGVSNRISGSTYSSIIGGLSNKISGDTYSFIGGGYNNEINGHSAAAIIGGGNNTIHFDLEGTEAKVGETILGGWNNTISASSYSTILGGQYNEITNYDSSAILGGLRNKLIDTVYDTYPGPVDFNSEANDETKYSTIIGGVDNSMTGKTSHCSILGGSGNTINGNFATGTNYDSAIVGGRRNVINEMVNRSVILGGQDNSISGTSESSGIFAGTGNTITSHRNAFIGGGSDNLIDFCWNLYGDNTNESILGGKDNKIFSSYNSAIIGGSGNTVDNSFNGEGGGNNVLFGGLNNNVTLGLYSSLIGGKDNSISGSCHSISSAIIAGSGNTNFGDYSVIIGGKGNYTRGGYISILNSQNSTIQGTSNNSQIIGGDNHSIYTSQNSVIIGGSGNTVPYNPTPYINTVILGGVGITAASSDMVYVPNMIINTGGTQSKLGINTSTPEYVIDAKGNNARVLFADNFTGADAPFKGYYLSGNSTNGTQLAAITRNYLGGNSLSLGMGVLGNEISTTVNTALLGASGDTFINSSQQTNNLNIINRSGGSGTNNIRMYAGVNSVSAAATPDLIIRGSGTTRGFVGLSVVEPTQQLDISGNTRIRTIGSTASAGALHYTADGTLTTNTSDERLKTNITTLTGALDKVNQLRGVTYNWTENPNGDTRIGFIAQEVNSVVPELTFTNPNSPENYMGVHYDNVTALLVEAVKELSSGVTTSNNTHLETQTILAEDNNVELNFNGNQQTAIGGGLSVLHAKGQGLSSDLITDANGNFITNNDFIPQALTIPLYTPTSSNDTAGSEGNITRDDNFLYIKTSSGWKRTNLENF